jgi:hypothetical protein
MQLLQDIDRHASEEEVNSEDHEPGDGDQREERPVCRYPAAASTAIAECAAR